MALNSPNRLFKHTQIYVHAIKISKPTNLCKYNKQILKAAQPLNQLIQGILCLKGLQIRQPMTIH